MFDTLGYARYLREGGVPPDQAETHAEAANRFIMADLATRADLQATKSDLQNALETQALRITVRLGAMLVVGFGIMTAIIGFLIRLH
jgi:F0F1-type ATP synthase assembly protein I